MDNANNPKAAAARLREKILILDSNIYGISIFAKFALISVIKALLVEKYGYEAYLCTTYNHFC